MDFTRFRGKTAQGPHFALYSNFDLYLLNKENGTHTPLSSILPAQFTTPQPEKGAAV
jgi:hypothetical protein